jgi:phage shock protein PspC (stress-responsive transcriptional regulator)
MQVADTAEPIPTGKRAVPLPLRNDTMLGVCTGLGEEFGFNPNYLRVAIAALFLVSFKIAIGAYLALGIGLAVGRLLFRNKQAIMVQASSQPPVQANDTEAAPETLAA